VGRTLSSANAGPPPAREGECRRRRPRPCELAGLATPKQFVIPRDTEESAFPALTTNRVWRTLLSANFRITNDAGAPPLTRSVRKEWEAVRWAPTFSPVQQEAGGHGFSHADQRLIETGQRPVYLRISSGFPCQLVG
jgi:hypothetical protein